MTKNAKAMRKTSAMNKPYPLGPPMPGLLDDQFEEDQRLHRAKMQAMRAPVPSSADRYNANAAAQYAAQQQVGGFQASAAARPRDSGRLFDYFNAAQRYNQDFPALAGHPGMEVSRNLVANQYAGAGNAMGTYSPDKAIADLLAFQSGAYRPGGFSGTAEEAMRLGDRNLSGNEQRQAEIARGDRQANGAPKGYGSGTGR